LPALILLLEPLWRAILKNTFISVIEEWVNSIIAATPQLASPQNLMILVAVIPMLIGLGAFALQARTGFNLHASRTKPVYLPHGFSEVVAFIRDIQDTPYKPHHADEKTLKARKTKLKLEQKTAPQALS
jgi:hypothetical protein